MQDLYPKIQNLIDQNDGTSCSKINNIEYFVDPLSKIVAFMLSCPESQGFTAYEIVYVIENSSLSYMGQKKLQILPDPYWKLVSVQPSSQVIAAVTSSINSMFKAGIALDTIMFVSQLTFVKG
jgi:hypothetical protein